MSEDSQGPGCHRGLRKAAPFVFVGLVLLPLFIGQPCLLTIPLLVTVGYLLFRDILLWYRNPSIPGSVRLRRLAKVLIRVVKWVALLPAVIVGIPLFASWLYVSGSLHPNDLYVLLVVMAFGLVAVTLEIIDRRLKWPRPVGHCQQCGYNLAGNVSGRCPECGVTIGADWLGDSDQKELAAAPTPPEMRNR